MQTPLYNQDGQKTGAIDLPEAVFNAPKNNDLVHQVVLAMQANARTPIAHTKDRADVRGGGKKPWRQKGTGRARHGSIRSPLWRGGGVTFGPTNERSFKQKINKKMAAKALYTVLSQKLRDNEILFVDTLTFSEPKTQQAKSVLVQLAKIEGFETLATKRRNALLLAFGEEKSSVGNATKSFRNFGSVTLEHVRNLNPVDVLRARTLIITNPSESVAFLAGKMEKKKAEVKGSQGEK